MTLENMKPERDASEEFFEYDAEELLVFLTLLITEGRTPEYSVKGRTEGLHCPPAQSAMPPLHRHECSDKLPQCRQARRTRSEVILLWRNGIPVMIEVMLLPDCCYGDEVPPSGDIVSDPVIKQDALLLERWTLQPVPRQSGDRFIEEKTLLLAMRSYVFFSQLSAWLSASHGIVPRNILYRISAADEELVWKFSQPPSEHVFPVPNVSQSVALQVRVQSLPRQPTYPTLACTIHTGLPPLYSKTPSLSPIYNTHGGLPALKKRPENNLEQPNSNTNSNSNLYSKGSTSMSMSGLLNGLSVPNLPINNIPVNTAAMPAGAPYTRKSQESSGEDNQHAYQNGAISQGNGPTRESSPLFRRLPKSPTPSRSHSPCQLPMNKAGKWLYQALNGSQEPTTQVEDTCHLSGKSKGLLPTTPPNQEPLRSFKTFSLVEPPRSPSPRPETNPLIGSLLHERQEVIARIAQRLNFCDGTAPPVLFNSNIPPPPNSTENNNTTPTPKAMWGGNSNHEEMTASTSSNYKTKEKPEKIPPIQPYYETVGRVLTDPFNFNTPVNDSTALGKRENVSSSSSAKPAACRKLRMTEIEDGEEEEEEEDNNGEKKEKASDRGRESNLIAQAVQDITRLIQERLSVPSLSPRQRRSNGGNGGGILHQTHTTTITHTVRTYTHTSHATHTQASHTHTQTQTATNGYVANGLEPHQSSSSSTHTSGATDTHTDTHTNTHTNTHTHTNANFCTKDENISDNRSRTEQCHDSPVSLARQNGAQSNSNFHTFTLEDTASVKAGLSHSHQRHTRAGQRLRTHEKLRERTPSPEFSSPNHHASIDFENGKQTRNNNNAQNSSAQMFSWTCSDSVGTAMDCDTSPGRVKPRSQVCGAAQVCSTLQDENQAPSSEPSSPDGTPPSTVLRAHSPSPLRPCNSWRKQNRHSLDSTATKAFHPCTGLPLLSSPVPQRKNPTGYFDLDAALPGCKGLPWAAGKRLGLKGEGYVDEQLFSASAPPASLSLLGNFEECVLNYRLEPLGLVEGFTAEVGASGSFCPSHMTLPVDVSFYSVSDDNAPSPYMGVINLESLGKRGYRVPPSGTIQVTLFNPNQTVVKMFVVTYDLRAMPSGQHTFLRQRTFSVPARRDTHTHSSRKANAPGHTRTLRYLVHLRFHSSKSGKLYLHRDIRLLFSRKSMEVDSGAAYELQSFTETPMDPA